MMLRRPKVAIIGGGNVGTACAHQIALKELADITVIDIPERIDHVQGIVLEITECAPIDGFDVDLRVSSDYRTIEESDVVIITAGYPRHPGMTRDDLIEQNYKIIVSASERISEYAPESIVIVVTNPLDAMAYAVWQVTGFSRKRVLGHSGCLDTSRYRTFISKELGISAEDVHALIIGSHGDEMVPLKRYTTVHGIPVSELLPAEKVESCIRRAKQAGTEIVKLKGVSAFYTPGSSITEMVESILKDKRRILPCSVYCEKEYRVGGYFIGVPCIIGSNGVEKIIELRLNGNELEALNASVNHVKSLVEIVEQLSSHEHSLPVNR